ncbi:MAG: NYN domain-containing protein [Patescibacteria group bacterium]
MNTASKNQTIKHPEQRVGVFIDVQNLYYSAKNLYHAKVNFGNVVQAALAGRKLIRAIAYVVRTETGEERPFFEALKNFGIETKERDIQVFIGGAKKADWDVGIVVDAIRISPTLDAVVIVSGDGDFIPLMQYLRNQGRQVEAVAFRETASSALIEEVDAFIDLSADKDHFLIRDNKNGDEERKPARVRKRPSR